MGKGFAISLVPLYRVMVVEVLQNVKKFPKVIIKLYSIYKQKKIMVYHETSSVDNIKSIPSIPKNVNQLSKSIGNQVFKKKRKKIGYVSCYNSINLFRILISHV